MIFNIVSFFVFLISIFVSKFLAKWKHGEIFMRILSSLILLYKMVYFVYQNIYGNISIPVEISTISYFIVSILITFKLVNFYNIAAFLGLSSGIGYFVFYIFAGFTIENSLSIQALISANFTHGYLLIAGLYILQKYNFKNKRNKLPIWTAMLAIIAWALVFFDVEQRGITFIYYIIKPQFLNIFGSFQMNILALISFYVLVIFLFSIWIKLYFKLNENLHSNFTNSPAKSVSA